MNRLRVLIRFDTVCSLSVLIGSCSNALCLGEKMTLIIIIIKKIFQLKPQVKALKALGPLSRACRHMDTEADEGTLAHSCMNS